MIRRLPSPVRVSPVALGAVLSAVALAGCTTPEKVPLSATSGARDCAGAALALAPDRVVGTFDGKPIVARDLGEELVAAEVRALHEYCEAVHSARVNALDGYVTRQLVQRAAAAAGQSEEEWVRAEVQKRIPQPSDAEVRAFYDERKRPDAPPLELVRDQVVMAMQQDQSTGALREVIEGLEKGAAVTRALPDVRPPPRDVTPATHSATKGGASAKVRVVEFADFQCPYCTMAASSVKALHARYGDKVEFAYRHFPLRSIHPDAQRAAEYAQCAREQGRFWELHDKLYEEQQSLDEASLQRHAASVGLDATKIEACLGAGRGASEVNADVKKAEELGVQGTPSFFVNGRLHSGAATVEALAATIDAELAR